MRWCSVVVAVLLATGCGSFDEAASTGGDAGGTETDDATAGTATVGVGGSSCGPAATCVPLPPADWQGPIAIHDRPAGQQAPSCLGSYDTMVLSAFGDPVTSEEGCTCACGAHSGGQCAPAVLTGHDVGSNCASPSGGGFMIGAGSCNSLSGGGLREFSVEIGPPLQLGQCPPMPGGAPVPPTSSTETIGCGASAPLATCGDDAACAPSASAPFEADLCIIRPGAHACPGDWPVARERYRDLVDGRTCGSCQCGASLQCESTIVRVSSCGGTGSQVQSWTPEVCIQMNFPASVEHEVELVGSCRPIAGPVEGAVEFADPLTVCCRAPT